MITKSYPCLNICEDNNRIAMSPDTQCFHDFTESRFESNWLVFLQVMAAPVTVVMGVVVIMTLVGLALAATTHSQVTVTMATTVVRMVAEVRPRK